MKNLKEIYKSIMAPSKEDAIIATKSSISQIEANNLLVEEIHDAFNTSSGKALAEANEILANITISAKGSLLNELGFTSTAEALRSQEAIREKQEKEELSKIIKEYNQTYPLYKFITEENVKAICKKYGLVMGEISKYKGDVPEKNLLEIKSFNEWKNNIKAEHSLVYLYFNHSFGEPAKIRKSDPISYPAGHFSTHEVNTYSICAPIKDMIVDSRTELKDGWKLQNIPDPVVLFPVYKGFLIVSAWGLEAEDSLVINEVNN